MILLVGIVVFGRLAGAQYRLASNAHVRAVNNVSTEE